MLQRGEKYNISSQRKLEKRLLQKGNRREREKIAIVQKQDKEVKEKEWEETRKMERKLSIEKGEEECLRKENRKHAKVAEREDAIRRDAKAHQANVHHKSERPNSSDLDSDITNFTRDLCETSQEKAKGHHEVAATSKARALSKGF